MWSAENVGEDGPQETLHSTGRAATVPAAPRSAGEDRRTCGPGHRRDPFPVPDQIPASVLLFRCAIHSVAS